MNQLPTLIKREFWEHRNTFLVLPAAAAGFVLIMMAFIFVASATGAIDMTLDIDSDEAHHWQEDNVITDDVVGYMLYRLDALHEADREEHINGGLHGLAVPFVGILWFVVFFYLLNTLYEDRRDRSILFWKSLPVSDALTVFSKLLTGLIIVPLVYLSVIVVLQLSSLVMLSLGTIGTEIPVWATLWGPATLFGNWFNYVALLIFYSFWALPFFAWLLAVSAFAKSVPLVWAIGVPIALSIVEKIVTSQSTVAQWMKEHTVPISITEHYGSTLARIESLILSVDMVSAIVVGGLLVYVAIWLRGRADEI